MDNFLESLGKDTAKAIFVAIITFTVFFIGKLIGNLLNKEFSEYQIGFAFQTLLVIVGLGIMLFGDLLFGCCFVLVGLYNHFLLHRNIKKRIKEEQKKAKDEAEG